ncbi:hypothetical protein E2C01_002589 [Portunus trituberculatus]|uniref:Uncharacterized protein n=1 Tax=Portunus trituberculatus TaxID=210409 RepID=A0A5B7CK57_PORTR|nr:hypothetical protein [Portunus trituberculatus]
MSKEATVSLFVGTQVNDEDSGVATVARVWRVCVLALLLEGKTLTVRQQKGFKMTIEGGEGAARSDGSLARHAVLTDAHLAAPCCPTRPTATFPLIHETRLYMRWFLCPQGGDETSGQQILRVTREVVRVGTSAWPRLETRAHARRQTAGALSPYCLGHRRGISSGRLYDAWV